MAAYTVKEIDESNYYVYAEIKNAVKVKIRREKDKYYTVCKCYSYLEVGDCVHCKALRVAIAKNWKEVKLKKNKELEEYIGGDLRGQINYILKRLTY